MTQVPFEFICSSLASILQSIDVETRVSLRLCRLTTGNSKILCFQLPICIV